MACTNCLRNKVRLCLLQGNIQKANEIIEALRQETIDKINKFSKNEDSKEQLLNALINKNDIEGVIEVYKSVRRR